MNEHLMMTHYGSKHVVLQIYDHKISASYIHDETYKLPAS
jgi:hypothetical protein